MPDLALPAGSVLLHVGPRKTGTTGIQVGLANARDRLTSYGVAYPEPRKGTSWTHYDRTRAASPGWAVLRSAPPGFDIPDISVWEKFAADVRSRAAAGLRVCVSSETFGNAVDSGTTRRIIHDLGGENVHVVYATRALHRLLPSHWQQEVKVNLETHTYAEWLRIVLSDKDREAARRAFWYAHDLEAAATAWLAATAPANVTVIATDDSDRRLIPHTVEAMLALPDRFLEPEEKRTNPSLGADEVEVLRQLNVLAKQSKWPTGEFTTLQRGTTRGLGTVAGTRRPLLLPAWAAPMVEQRSREHREVLGRLQLQIVGDPDCLLMPEGTPTADGTASEDAIATGIAAQAIADTMVVSFQQTKQAKRKVRKAPGKARAADLPGRALVKELAKRVMYRMHVRRPAGGGGQRRRIGG